MILNDSMIIYNKMGYFCERTTGSIFSYDPCRLKLELLSYQEGDMVARKYRKIVRRDNEMFCIPDMQNNIKVYDLDSKEVFFIELDNIETKRFCTMNAWIVGDCLWFVSNYSKELLEVSISKMCLVGKYKIFDQEDLECGYKCDLHDNKIYCVSQNAPRMAIFNIESKQCRQVDLCIKDKGFNTIQFLGEDLLLTGYENYIYVMVDDGNILKEVLIMPIDLFENKKETTNLTYPLFDDVIVDKNQMVFIPSGVDFPCNQLVSVIKDDSYRINRYDFRPFVGNKKSIFDIEYLNNGTLTVLVENQYMLYEIDLSTGIINPRMTQLNVEKLIGKGLPLSIITEGYMGITLEDFVRRGL